MNRMMVSVLAAGCALAGFAEGFVVARDGAAACAVVGCKTVRSAAADGRQGQHRLLRGHCPYARSPAPAEVI